MRQQLWERFTLGAALCGSCTQQMHHLSGNCAFEGHVGSVGVWLHCALVVFKNQVSLTCFMKLMALQTVTRSWVRSMWPKRRASVQLNHNTADPENSSYYRNSHGNRNLATDHKILSFLTVFSYLLQVIQCHGGCQSFSLTFVNWKLHLLRYRREKRWRQSWTCAFTLNLMWPFLLSPYLRGP